MGTANLDAFARRAEHRLAADAGVLVEEFFVRLRGTGHAVRVLASGEGQPYLLLHGEALSAAWWIPLMPYLTGRLVAVDLPGHGLSDAYDSRTATLRAAAVDLVTAVLDIERLEQAVLVGHSLGGAAALWTALDAPERVSRIVLISDAGPAVDGYRAAPVRGVTGPPERYAAALADRLREPALLRLPRLTEAAYYCTHRQRSDARIPALHRAAGPHLVIDADELSRIDMPVRYLRGRDDVVHPMQPHRAAVARMPRGACRPVPGGHAPWLGAPALIGALIGTSAPAGEQPALPPHAQQSAT